MVASSPLSIRVASSQMLIKPSQSKTCFSRGMTTLTGAADSKAAWSALFQPGDVVGIKVNPVGSPRVISSPEALNEIINGLKLAGVKTNDIVVYDRYRAQFFKAGFDKWLPQGVRISNATEDYETVQQAIEGYDPDHYLDFPTTLPGQDISSRLHASPMPRSSSRKKLTSW